MSVTLETPPSLSLSRNSDRSIGSDESLEISFEYAVTEDGKVIRISKGSDKSPQSVEKVVGPSPPTPPHTQELALLSSAMASSSLADGPERRRSSLSRSESMPGADALMAPARSLSRAASGPISLTTPGQPSRSSYAPLSGGLQGTGRKIGGAQRIRKDEADRQRRELDERLRKEVEETERTERERARRAIEEKENAQVERHSPPHGNRQIASLPSRQSYYNFPKMGLNGMRAGVSAMKSNVPKINETDVIEEESDYAEYGNHYQHQYSQKKSPPEKIASYESRALSQPARTPSQYGLGNQIKSQSVASSSSKARRVTPEERLRQEQEIAEEERQAMERAQAEAAAQSHSRQSPSPTHKNIQAHPAAAHLRHQRRDSDTLRSGLPVAKPAKRSESLDNYEQDLQYEEPQRPQRLSPPPRSKSAAPSLAHRNSPTARDIATAASATLVEQDEHDSDNGRPEKPNIPRSLSQPPQQQPQQIGDVKPRNLIVNRKPYARLDMIGKGGSSRVYRCMNSANEIYAIKRVALDKTDADTINGYMNEIALLRRLGGNSRIIKLIDSEVKGGVNGSKGYLMLVMECGEVDLAKLIQDRQKEAMNMVWISYYWQQILECVNIIHEEKIVHSDLKPANFVLVRGQLKLIDFGIANAIANDTTNIQRDHQIGTVNYMSPEAIEVPDGLRRLKVGRPSDVWSLGCILYQMVYGHPPFHHLTVFQKMKAIPDKDHIIEFPEIAVPIVPGPRNSNGGPPSPPKRLEHLARPVRKDVIETMKRCLIRPPKERAIIPELLEDEWLSMKDPQVPQPQIKLKHDETIINPFYMRQLLQYAYRTSREGRELSEEEQMEEAERLVQELKSIA